MRRHLFLALTSIAAALGCAETYYAYRPIDRVTTVVANRPASEYDIPAEHGKGSLSVATFGLVDMTLAEGEEPVPAVGVRMVAENDGDTAWRIDTRSEVLDVDGEGRIRAAYVNADTTGLPDVEVPPRTTRTLDFYYPLPEAHQDGERLPSFEFVWSVKTPTGNVDGRTRFERYEYEPVRPPPPAVVWGPPYWGPYWWYDPWWDLHPYWGVRVVHPIYVHPVPRPYRVYPRPVPYAHPAPGRPPPARHYAPAHPVPGGPRR